MNRRELSKNIQRVILKDYYNKFDVSVERKKRFKDEPLISIWNNQGAVGTTK